MFNPHIFSRSEVNQNLRQETIPRSLCSHCQYGYKYFSLMSLCKELNSDLSFTQFQKLFFLYGPTIQGCLCVPHFSFYVRTHVVYLYNLNFGCGFFLAFFLYIKAIFCHYKINFIK